MKTIKDLTVKVTYTVGLSDVQVSDVVYDALEFLADLGETNCDHIDDGEEVGRAFEWLTNHIREDDACDWSYEVDIE
ncbi:MAG: hypothetical protein SO013_06110 [Prevotella sp.]|nr:hypothetical protein [Prevotella sp.]